MADEPTKPVKRLVKNPETFRERAIKAADEGDKPKTSARLKQAGSNVASPVLKPVGSAAGKLFARKPFQLLRKPLRIIGLVLVPPYFRKSWRELRQVQWPGRRESLRLTGAVLIFAIIFGATIAVVDYGLDKLFRNVLLK